MGFVITEIEGEANEFAESLNAILDATALELGLPFVEVPLHLRADDAGGRLLGGLSAISLQGWLFIKYLAVVDGQRGSGIGAALVSKSEEIARQRGLAGVYLDTFDFQAPRFYVSMGYTECGRLPAVDGAAQRIWFAKTFDMAV